MADQPAVNAAIITAIIGPVIAGLMVYLRTRRRESADVDVLLRKMSIDQEVSVSGVVLTWAQRLEAQMERLHGEATACRAELRALRQEVDAFREHNRLLVEQVRGLGGAPVLMPPRG